MPTQRQLRVGEEIRHVLANVMQRGDIATLGDDLSSITVTEVRISPDLSAATAFVVPLGGGRVTSELVQSLNSHSSAFRNALAKNMSLRRVPTVNFRADTQFETSDKIDELLRKAKECGDIP